MLQDTVYRDKFTEILLETYVTQKGSIVVETQHHKTMSKLEQLYEARENFQNLGIAPNADLERQLAELEEDIIRNEIVPIITEKIEPVLNKVRRQVVLVVEHNPNDGVSVHLSRKRNVSNAFSDAVTISSIDDDYEETREHKEGITRPRTENMKPATKLRVTFMEDGTVFCESKAADTLKKAILKFGPERVAQLCIAPYDNILQLNRVNLVTKRRDEKYGHRQHEIGNGWLVFTCSNTESKKRQIEAIAKALSQRVKIEII